MRRAGEEAMRLLLLICALTAVACLLLMAAYLILAGLPAIREIGLGDFLLGRTWDAGNRTDPRFGILPLLLSTVCAAAGAIALGVPLGLLTALFLAKAAPPRLAAAVRWLVGLLAGVPSVVCGLVGMCVVTPWLRERLDLPAGDTLLAAILVLAVMILPSVVSVSEEALSAVPAAYEEGSLALGATETETWFRVTLPAAGSGVAASVVLGTGRAMGEAMAVLMVAGNVPNMPSLLSSVRLLTTGLAMELGYAPAGSLQRQALFSIALVLFVLIVAVNVLLDYALRAGRRT